MMKLHLVAVAHLSVPSRLRTPASPVSSLTISTAASDSADNAQPTISLIRHKHSAFAALPRHLFSTTRHVYPALISKYSISPPNSVKCVLVVESIQRHPWVAFVLMTTPSMMGSTALLASFPNSSTRPANNANSVLTICCTI